MSSLSAFDIEGYLLEKGGHHSEGKSGIQMVLSCPNCGKEKLYVNIDDDSEGRGRWVCFKCSTELDGYKGNLLQLVALVEGVSYGEAAKYIAESLGMRKRAASKVKRDLALREMKDKQQQSLGEDMLPIEFEPCYLQGMMRLPKYLAARGVTDDQAYRYKLGFCASGKYAHRIVFPIDCPLGRSFTARTMLKDGMPSYLAGPNEGKLVLGYHQACERIEATQDKTLVCVEGPFDVLGVDRASLATIGFCGKAISREKVRMVESIPGVKRVVLCLDPDAVTDAVRQCLSLGVVHWKVVPNLGGHKDPGVAPPEVIQAAVANAEPLSVVWARIIKDRLKKRS